MKLEASGISFRYQKGNREILNNVSLEIDSSERVGLIAPSGFGKTTFCKILAGYQKPDQGMVLLDGKIRLIRLDFEVRSLLDFCFQIK